MASAQSENAVVPCPGCGSALSVPRSMIGKRARCASCSLAFTIPTPPAGPPPTKQAPPKPKEQVPPAPPVPEHVGFNCRVCDTRLYANVTDVGKQFKCADCGALTVIPPPPAEKPKNIPAAMEGEQYELWEPDEQPLPSALIATEPKTVTLKCRRCDTVMHPLASLFGQPVRCPDCGTTNIVPSVPVQRPRASVLAPDALTPQLDPDAHPGERPYVPAPSGGMYHEDQFEDEYRRAKEKAERTGKPMEIDHRGRPVMPRWPLISGVLPFLVSRGVPFVWVLLSAGFAAAAWVLLTGIAAAYDSGGAFIGVPKIAGGSALLMMTTAAAYSCFLQIIMESSEGNRQVHHWPVFTDWLASLLWFGVAVPMSALPGWAIAHIPGVADVQGITPLLSAASGYLFLPIVMLSQLDINSPAGVLSGRILTSLIKVPFSWMLFYFEVALLVAACGGATYLVFTYLPGSVLWLVLLYTAALILFARLLGRLAWRLAEAMPIEEEVAI